MFFIHIQYTTVHIHNGLDAKSNKEKRAANFWGLYRQLDNIVIVRPLFSRYSSLLTNDPWLNASSSFLGHLWRHIRQYHDLWRCSSSTLARWEYSVPLGGCDNRSLHTHEQRSLDKVKKRTKILDGGLLSWAVPDETFKFSIQVFAAWHCFIPNFDALWLIQILWITCRLEISSCISTGQFTNHVVHGGWIPTMSLGPIKGPSSRDHGVSFDYPVP